MRVKGNISVSVISPIKLTLENISLQEITGVRNGKIPTAFRDRLPKEVGEIIKLQLAHDRSHRPTAHQIIEGDQLRNLRKKINKSKNPYVPKF